MSVDWGVVAGVGTLSVAAAAAVVSWRKAPSESAKILVDASKDVVVVQRGLIDQLEERLTMSEARNAEQAQRLATLERASADHTRELEDRVRLLETENASLRDENEALRRRVKHLEDELLEEGS